MDTKTCAYVCTIFAWELTATGLSVHNNVQENTAVKVKKQSIYILDHT